MTIISVHLPKTAGTSFGESLKMHFGAGYRDDYADKVIVNSVDDRCRYALSASRLLVEQGLGNIECVHGHFMPVKYLALGNKRDLTFVTWLREPVARMISHYYYWQQSFDEQTAAPHHRQVVEQRWTLERFCLSEQFRDIYTQYLWGFPIEKFAFVGISEYFQEDLPEFSQRYLSTHLEAQHRNMGKLNSRRAMDEGFLREVRDFHAGDMQLYQTALALRLSRHASAPSTTTASSSMSDQAAWR
jgi:hypothetical protein